MDLQDIDGETSQSLPSYLLLRLYLTVYVLADCLYTIVLMPKKDCLDSILYFFMKYTPC